jgi:hypothetical protein
MNKPQNNVFFKPILHTGTHKQSITKKCKIQIADFFLHNEFRNQQKLQQLIPSFAEHFAFSSLSPLNTLEVDSSSTQLINSNNIKKNDHAMLVEYHSRQLLKWRLYFSQLRQNSNSHKYVLQIILFYKQLLHTCSLLVRHEIVQNFIHTETLFVDEHENILISDFSISLDINRCLRNKEYLQEIFIRYDPTNVGWSIELHFLSFLFSNKLSSLSMNNIQKVINDYINNHFIFQQFGNVSQIKQEALKYYEKYFNQPLTNILNDIFSSYNTWDNLGVSTVYLQLLIKIHKSINQENKFISHFIKLLLCNIHPVPARRLSIAETLIQFNSLLEETPKQVYQQLINYLMSSSTTTSAGS